MEVPIRAPILLVLAVLGAAAVGEARAQGTREVVVETDVIYSRDQGSAMLADPAYSRGQRGLPAIINVHGGRWRGGSRNYENALDVRDWASAGYFAMTIDYQLVGGSPAPAPYQDLLSAIRFVRAHADQYGVDPDRGYLIGDSSGKHLVSLAATLGAGPYEVTGSWSEASTAIRAAISVAGPYDLNTLSWGKLWTPVTGNPEEARRLASPIYSVGAGTRPILVIHSDDDRSVPVQQAVEMAAEMAAAGVLHRFVHWQDRGHMRITDEVVRQAREFIAPVECDG